MTKKKIAVEAEAPMGAPLPPYEHKRVPFALLRPDPDQPRKNFPEASLQEMAASIRQKGIIQDLILEYVPAPYKILPPDLMSNKWRVTTKLGEEEMGPREWEFETEAAAKKFVPGDEMLEPHYRIVCGERRWRGAGIVGLAEIPAKVYTGLTQRQRADLQIIENHQRENVSALEEAAALQKQLDERRRTDATFSPEKLAAELGMSRAGIYERLKLNRLQPKIREVLVAGTISTSIAAEVAKLPTLKLQEKMLKTIEERSKYHPMSVRDVQEEIDEEYVKDLADAPFDTKNKNPFSHLEPKDISRLPEGTMVGSCTDCRYRTGNMVAEFPDLKSRPNVCTSPVCFGEKCKVHWQREAQDLAQKGKTVLTEKEFKAEKGKYVAGDHYEYANNRNGTFEQLMGKHKPEPVLVATAEGLQKFYVKEDAVAAARKNGVKFNRAQSAAEKEKEKAAREAGDKLRTSRNALAEKLAPNLAKGIAELKDSEIWGLLKPRAEVNYGFGYQVQKGTKKDRDYVIAGMLFQNRRNVTDWQTGKWDEDTLALWKRLGVDLEAEEAAAAPKPELPLATKGEQQKELAGMPHKGKKLSVAAIARIRAAQKARWAKIKAK